MKSSFPPPTKPSLKRSASSWSRRCRAKGIESVRRYLAEVGKLDTQTLELDRRDLAGARLIFYTNNQ